MEVDLYYGRIDLRRYLPQPGPECRDCDAASCRSFGARLGDARLAQEARRGPLPAESCP
jgi:ArsR family metal-binding transcriptional regulator